MQSQDTPSDADEATVFRKLGGWTPLNLAVELFYSKVLDDPLLAPFFVGIPMDKLRKKQLAFMAFAFGGADNFFGKTVEHAHRHLIVTAGLDLPHFDAVAGHFVATLTELGVPGDIIGEAAGIVLTTRPLFDRQATLAKIAEEERAVRRPVADQLRGVQEQGKEAAGRSRSTAGHEGSDGGAVRVSTLVDVLASIPRGPSAAPPRASESGGAAPPDSSSPAPAPAVGTEDTRAEVKRQRRQMLKALMQGLSMVPSSGGGVAPSGVSASVDAPAGTHRPAPRDEEEEGSGAPSVAATAGTTRSVPRVPPAATAPSQGSLVVPGKGQDSAEPVPAVKVAAWLESSSGDGLCGAQEEDSQPPSPGASAVALAASLPHTAAQVPTSGLPPAVPHAARPAPPPLLKRVLGRGGAGSKAAHPGGRVSGAGGGSDSEEDSARSSSSGVSLPEDSDDELAAHLATGQPVAGVGGSRLAAPSVPVVAPAACLPGEDVDLSDGLGPGHRSTPGASLSRVQVANLSTLSEVSETAERGSTSSPAPTPPLSTPVMKPPPTHPATAVAAPTSALP